MFPSSLILLAIPLACQAITIPFNQVQRSGSYLHGLPNSDRHHNGFLKNVVLDPTTIAATNLAFVQYTVSVGIGSPRTYYEVVVDTGSSNTWVGASKPYVHTRRTNPTGQNVTVSYGAGSFVGQEFIDEITLASGFVVRDQSIGDALQSAGFPGVDGIIGVGPVALTVGTLSNNNALVPTISDNALSQGLISTEVLGISFAPANSEQSVNGAITFGGVDESLFVGEIRYVPMTSTYPSNFYFGLNVTSATYGTTGVINQSTAGIVDTGTTLILLADDFFATYQAGIPGSYVDDITGLFVIPQTQIANLLPFNFTIGDTVYSLTANAQLMPQDQNPLWGGVLGVQYGLIGPSGSPSGEGLDFTLGQKFMERYYAALDLTENRIGFAFTTNTFS